MSEDTTPIPCPGTDRCYAARGGDVHHHVLRGDQEWVHPGAEGGRGVMPKMPKRISVERKGDRVHIFVDGAEFPFFTDGGAQVVTHARRDHMPAITITIPADRVEVVDDFNAAPDGSAD